MSSFYYMDSVENGICDYLDENYILFFNSLTLNKPNSIFSVELLILCYNVSLRRSNS